MRAGGGIVPAAMPLASATAISARVATPLALSFAPGSCTCAAMTIRSSGSDRPGISAISVRIGLVVNWLAIVTRTERPRQASREAPAAAASRRAAKP